MFSFYGGDDFIAIKEKFTYILKELRKEGKVQQSENKAKSETFRFIVNRVYYQMRRKKTEIEIKFRGKKK